MQTSIVTFECKVLHGIQSAEGQGSWHLPGACTSAAVGTQCHQCWAPCSMAAIDSCRW